MRGAPSLTASSRRFAERSGVSPASGTAAGRTQRGPLPSGRSSGGSRDGGRGEPEGVRTTAVAAGPARGESGLRPPNGEHRTGPLPAHPCRHRRASTRITTPSPSGGSTHQPASRTPRRPDPSPAAASTRSEAGSLPSRRDHSRRRRGLGATHGTGGKSVTSTLLRGNFSTGKGGSLPAPLPMTPNCGVSVADSQGGQRESRSREWHKQWQKGRSA